VCSNDAKQTGLSGRGAECSEFALGNQGAPSRPRHLGRAILLNLCPRLGRAPCRSHESAGVRARSRAPSTGGRPPQHRNMPYTVSGTRSVVCADLCESAAQNLRERALTMFGRESAARSARLPAAGRAPHRVGPPAVRPHTTSRATSSRSPHRAAALARHQAGARCCESAAAVCAFAPRSRTVCPHRVVTPEHPGRSRVGLKHPLQPAARGRPF
jgi:hypothetical protein